MTATVPVVIDVLVDAPVAAVHGGDRHATVTVLPEEAVGGIDGALRVYEQGRVVPGLTTQLHDFGAVAVPLGRLAPGWHSLTAAYTGGSRYRCALSAPFTVLVLPAATVADLVVPAAGVARGGTVAVTVRTIDGSWAASGWVSLYERARLIATGEVVEGVGTVRVPAGLAPGRHLFFAAYAGTETHCPSETAVVPVTVLAD
jgi:hypothetical protein